MKINWEIKPTAHFTSPLIQPSHYYLVSLCESYLQELRSREEELTRAALQQKSQEELLKRREQQLAEREIDVLERELNIMIFQLNQEKPNVKKRKGKFKRSRLKLKDGHRISLPSGLLFFFF